MALHTRLSPLFSYLLIGIAVLIIGGMAWQWIQPPPKTGDWQSQLAVLSTAEFNGDSVTIKNVRNFRYEGSESEQDMRPAYYDRKYDLTKLVKVWYVSEPFKELSAAAHTFLSFEFSDGNFLSITIEARKLKGQDYKLEKGLLHTYPLMYIAADERDSIFVRANIRKSDIYLYPVRTTPEKGRQLLVDMLEEMNQLAVEPEWYNTMLDNCTSRIAYHVNRITPGRLPALPWESYVTGFADKFALEHNLLDTELPLEEARKKYYITPVSQSIEPDENYSEKIRSGWTD
ncbi:DUF4105 domain-containing protein [Candidatus Uhrbacteria bacterium]|nr:DUF4105 domain-containing protein [Candidatus Uhrbacteria bacterium]